MKFRALFLSLLFFPVFTSAATTVRYELSISQTPMNLSGKKEVDFALSVNGTIPAPTLEFTEGDTAEITVTNNLTTGEEVSIHWHGILLPPEEDGVPYVNTPPIKKGQSHTFRFKIRQHGTYWYHSHTGLQEQKGVYGAFIIHPKEKKASYDKDLVAVISDWSDEDGDQILRNLKKDGDYYLYKKNSVRSLWGAIKAGKLGNYFKNEWIRMGGMDLSDVGYDAFLINGQRESQLADLRPGQTARVRIINAASSSYFYISLGGELMTVISADGVDISPVQTREILMGMAETYDILFTPQENKNYELRSTVQDVTGHASAWIGSGERVFAPDKPEPDYYESMDHSGHHADHADHADRGGHAGDHVGDHADPHAADPHPGHHASHSHVEQGGHHATSDEIEMLTVEDIAAQSSTAFSGPVKEVKLVLTGDMRRYVWHINGKTIAQDTQLEIQEGDVIRMIFENDTMMHHPMHLHGHFFRVLNQFGERSPLKHTVDVPPHETRTIEFLANEPGQWMLHCHNLYHLSTGMARIVKYTSWTPGPELAALQKLDPHLLDPIFTRSGLDLFTNHLALSTRLMRTWDELELFLEGRNLSSQSFSADGEWEAEGSLLYQRWLGKFLNLTGGADFYHEKTYGLLGVGYILPLLIESAIYVNHEGKFRMDLGKRLQWTASVLTDLDLSWRPDWGGEEELEYEVSLLYAPSWHWAAGLMLTEQSVGAGVKMQF